LSEVNQSTGLRLRTLYQDLSGDIKLFGLKVNQGIIFLAVLIFSVLLSLIMPIGQRLIIYASLALTYAFLFLNVNTFRKTLKQNKRDRKNASGEYLCDLKTIDYISEDKEGNQVAFTKNTVAPWELALGEQKESEARAWAMNLTELVCHRQCEVSVFAYTHMEKEAHFQRQYERGLNEKEETKDLTLNRVDHHSRLRTASMEVTYINRIRRLYGETNDYEMEDLIHLMPGITLGQSAILKLASHLSPNARRKRGKQV